MEEFVLLSLSYYVKLKKLEEDANKDPQPLTNEQSSNLTAGHQNEETVRQRHMEKNAKAFEASSSQSVQENGTPAEKNNTPNLEWLKNVIESDSQTSLTRRERIKQLIQLLDKCEHISFNFSTKSIVVGRGTQTSPFHESQKTIPIISFLRDLQIYHKRTPSSYLRVIDLLLPLGKSAELAKALIINRQCLSYIQNR